MRDGAMRWRRWRPNDVRPRRARPASLPCRPDPIFLNFLRRGFTARLSGLPPESRARATILVNSGRMRRRIRECLVACGPGPVAAHPAGNGAAAVRRRTRTQARHLAPAAQAGVGAAGWCVAGGGSQVGAARRGVRPGRQPCTAFCRNAGRGCGVPSARPAGSERSCRPLGPGTTLPAPWLKP